MGQEVEALAFTRLDERAAKFVELIVEGVEEDEARRLAGYGENTPAVSVLRGKLVQNAIRQRIDFELNGPLRAQALKKIRQIVTDPKAPAATAYLAAKFVIERGDEGDKGADKPMTVMSIEELEDLIRRKEAELKDVTPTNGA